MVGPLADLVDASEFRTGFLVGGVLAACCVVLALLVLRTRRPVPVAGVAMCFGAFIAAEIADVPFVRPTSMVVGLAALAAAGTVSAMARFGFLLRLALFVPGAALLLGTFTPGDHGFVEPFLFVFVVVGGSAAAGWGSWKPVTDIGPAVALLTVLGVYACVPDTERAAVVLGVVIPLALTGWPGRFSSLGSGGAAALVGLVAWVAGTDGAARPGAVVGAAACVGVLAFVPLLGPADLSLDGSARSRWGIPSAAMVLAVQALVVVVCSRVAGLETSAVSSAVIASAGLAAAVLLVRFLLPGASSASSPSAGRA